MKCSGCGAELAPDSKFCGECGAPRPEAPAPAVEVDRSGAQPAPVPVFGAAEAETRASKKGSRRKWAAIGCIGLLAVACVVAGLTGICLLTLLSQPQGSPIALPGVPSSEPTSAARPTPTWLPAPPTPTWQPAPSTPAPKPSIEPVVVMPYCSALDEPTVVYVQENQPVTVYWGWVATTPEYVQDFLDTATVEVFLDDEQVKPDTQSEIEYDFVDEGYVVSWSADVGTLTPGSHRLDYHVSWSRQISDGWHTYGPGGETEEEQEYCELIAE
jgi:hypothetical protein